jgi:hypothetical protein
MANPIEAAISGNLAGSTRQGALTPVPLAYAMVGQEAHIQRSATVEPGDTIGGGQVNLDLSGGGKGSDVQTLFLVKSDLPVKFQLNGDANLQFDITRPDGFFLLLGSPEVTDIQFESTVAPAADAHVHITKILGA